MRALIWIHRWLGIALCLFFAMWFATGIVMHFVPFPALSEPERIAGMQALGPTEVRHGPAAAVTAAMLADPVRVRLVARVDGPVYVVQSASAMAVVDAATLAPAAVGSPELALAIAAAHARARGLNATAAQVVELATHDQWTVPNGLDPHRPLYRVALGDAAGTELYVSSATGEVVRDTNAHERAWNYAGSVAHWIYPTLLRRNWSAWDRTVWTLSLVACVSVLAGAVIGVWRIGVAHGRLASPYRGWQAWHHWLGLGCMVFVLTWIVSGWLSMDHGRLFSTGKLEPNEASALRGNAAWSALPARGIAPPRDAVELEWFVFDSRIYRRERTGVESQRLYAPNASGVSSREHLSADEVSAAASRLGTPCAAAEAVAAADAYPIASSTPGAPVYRVVCGAAWFHVDSASGALLEKLDPSRRAYRWFYSALHTFDFPVLVARPAVRTSLIVLLCALGFAFSVTAVVIGWRRLMK